MGTLVHSHCWQYAQAGLRLIPLSGIPISYSSQLVLVQGLWWVGFASAEVEIRQLFAFKVTEASWNIVL